MAKKQLEDLEIAELEEKIAVIDATMNTERAVKEKVIAQLRELQRARDAFSEVLERKRAVERATSGRPAQVVGDQ